jgi:nicotinate phosphoribosyltransferase
MARLDPPYTTFVQPLLTDLYQVTMVYAYWKQNRHADTAVFELFFRKNRAFVATSRSVALQPRPLRTHHALSLARSLFARFAAFDGEFTIFAGLEDVLRFVENFSLDAESIAFLKAQLPHCEDAFFAYLAALDCSELKISAMREGSVAFPRVPCARVEGPLAVCQIIETTMLALCNYASLMTTNAARYRNAVGPSKQLLEFGLRRAQGPDGALSASRYAYMGGFDGTSNVLAAKLFGIPVGGTHAHSFVTAFEALDDVVSFCLPLHYTRILLTV